MKNNGTFLLAISIAALSAFIIYQSWSLSRQAPVYIQGEIEATQIRVSSKVPGRLESIMVKRGDTVDVGQLLFTISSPEIEARLQQAKAGLSGAKATSDKAQSGAQPEDIQAAYNTYQKAKAASELADKTLERVSNLHREGVLPAQRLDEATANATAAEQTANAAKAIWKKALNGAREEDKRAAAAMVQRAAAAVNEVESFLKETTILAPSKGEIANILAEPGELAPTGFPVITIADLSDCWAVFNIREDLLQSFQKGSRFYAAIPAMGQEKHLFEVSYLSALGNFATWSSTKTTGEWDLKTFEVHARPVTEIKGLIPGMSIVLEKPDAKQL